jgi:hypothetical protein
VNNTSLHLAIYGSAPEKDESTLFLLVRCAAQGAFCPIQRSLAPRDPVSCAAMNQPAGMLRNILCHLVANGAGYLTYWKWARRDQRIACRSLITRRDAASTLHRYCFVKNKSISRIPQKKFGSKLRMAVG